MDAVFVNGLIKSREKNLIPKRAFLQAADSESFQDAVKILFGVAADGETAPSEYEKLAIALWEEYFGFLKKYSPTEKFLRAVAAKYDFFNAEYALRVKFADAPEVGFMPEGLIGISDLKEYINGKKISVYAPIASAIDGGARLFTSGEATGRALSALFKRAYYAYMKKTVYGKEWKEFIVHEIDALNLSVALRSGDLNAAACEYIPGGKIAFKTLDLITSGKEEKALSALKFTDYCELLKKGISEKKEGKSLLKFELAADDFAMDKLKEKRFASEGITPILLYTYYKYAEIRNARIVLAGKLSGAESEDIKRRLRSGYEG